MSDNFPFEHFINLNPANASNKANQRTNSFNLSSDFSHLASNSAISTNKVQSSDSEYGQAELKSITDELLGIIEAHVTPQKYNAFFKNTFTVSKMATQHIEFTVTTLFVKKMIEGHYIEFLKNSIHELFGQEYQIIINVFSDQSPQESNSKNATIIQSTVQDNDVNQFDNNSVKSSTKPSFSINTSSSLLTTREHLMDEVSGQAIKHMNNNYGQKIAKNKKFENFIIGPSNNMAHAFAIAVAKDPGKVYPQLYLHGNSGLGKTHLLHAICNYILETNPQTKICITTANAFMQEMVEAIQNKNDDAFRRKYTTIIDVLIIDDIHELKNKARTQTEFFHIFNELQNKGKQLIFTSDKPPKEIDGIEDRIRTRLSSALIVEIQQPDLETRMAILKKKAIEQDIFISDEVINLIASCVKTNIRELEGKLVALGAYSDIMNVDIDLEIAKTQLGLTEDYEEHILSMDALARAVANNFKIPIGDLKGKSRIKEVTIARHIAMYMSHKILKKTLEEIGKFYDRDHTTVIHGVKKIEEQIKENPQVSQKIYEIESSL